MSSEDVDPLLRRISRDASSERPHADRYDISLVVGGKVFHGYVLSSNVFVEEVLPEELAADYGPLQEGDYLHLCVEIGTAGEGHNVRFRMDGIDAWWARSDRPDSACS